MDWSLKMKYHQVFSYHKGLITLRKAHPAFRMVLAEEIRRNITFYLNNDWVISFSLNNHANNDSWETIFVAYNAGVSPETVALPQKGCWHVVVDDNHAGLATLSTFTGIYVTVPERSTMVLYLDENRPQ